MISSTERFVIVVLPEAQGADDVVRRLRNERLPVRTYVDHAECLERMRGFREPQCCCVVCSLDGDDLPGLEFQRELSQLPHATAIVFCATRASTEVVVEAMRQDAVAVVELGDGLERLVDYVNEGLERSDIQYGCEVQVRETLERLGSLNVGEHQVLRGIMAGKLNKEIAQQLNLSVRTVEQRRRELFRKMDVQHPASLARRVIEAAHAPRLPAADDERSRWLQGLRHDVSHLLLNPALRRVVRSS